MKRNVKGLLIALIISGLVTFVSHAYKYAWAIRQWEDLPGFIVILMQYIMQVVFIIVLAAAIIYTSWQLLFDKRHYNSLMRMLITSLIFSAFIIVRENIYLYRVIYQIETLPWIFRLYEPIREFSIFSLINFLALVYLTRTKVRGQFK